MNSNNQSYYLCEHCRTKTLLQIKCPCCSLGDSDMFPSSEFYPMLNEILSWVEERKKHREDLFSKWREKYDFGYINALEHVKANILGKIKEKKNADDRLAGDTNSLGK